MRSLPPESRRERGAMTIIELVIVLLVMGILAAAAVPTFVESLMFHRVESAARRLKVDLELAQRTARLTSATQSISFTGATYSVSGATSLDKPGDAYTVNLAAEPYFLTTLTLNLGGDTSVSFDGYGRPMRGGRIYLAINDHERTVKLDATTGEVTIEP